MNDKFNKNAKVEKFTTMLGIAIRLIVIDPSKSKLLTQPHPQRHVISVICTDGQTQKQTERRQIRLLDAPGGPFRPGG